MNKLYIAALTDHDNHTLNIFTAKSFELLLKDLEETFFNEATFKTKEDVEMIIDQWNSEDAGYFQIEFEVVELE